jgi:EcsC protein family
MNVEVMPAKMSQPELEDLAKALRLLERRSLASRLTGFLGPKVQAIGRATPAPARKLIARATESALQSALRVAVRSLKRKPSGPAANRMHKAAVAASGAVGGAFGFSALAIELPVSTTILLRSIADIAREEGEDLSRPESSLACIEVFALGGPAKGESAIEGGYFAVRTALAQSVSESARFLLHGATGEAGPALVRLIAQIAGRFGLVVSEKAAAQAAPLLGAVGGAAINVAFAEHFQNLARGHFIVRRLERRHGADAVRFEYQRLYNAAASAA